MMNYKPRKKLIKFISVVAVSSLIFNVFAPTISYAVDMPQLNVATNSTTYTEGWTNGNVLLDITAASKADSISITVNDALASFTKTGPNTYNCIYEATSNGSYTVKVTDSEGQSIEKITKVENIDKALPTETSPGVSNTTQSSIQIYCNQKDTLSGIDTIKYRITNASGSIGTWQDSPTFNNLEQGKTYYFQTQVTDKAGNVRNSKVLSAGTVQYVNYDQTPPVVNYTISPEGWTNNYVSVDVTARDDMYIKSVKVVNGEEETELVLKDNKYIFSIMENGTVQVVAEDSSGNKTTVPITINNIDRKKPTNTAPSIYRKGDTSLTVINEQQDGDSGIASVKYRLAASSYGEVSLSGFDWQEVSNKLVKFEGLKPSTVYYVQTQVTDGAGNIQTSLITSVKTLENALPEASNVNSAPTDKEPQVYQSANNIFVYSNQIDRDGKIVDIKYRESDVFGNEITNWQEVDVFYSPSSERIHYYQTKAIDDDGAETISKPVGCYVQERYDSAYIDISNTRDNTGTVYTVGGITVNGKPKLYADMSNWTSGPVQVLAEGEEMLVQTRLNDNDWTYTQNQTAYDYGDRVYARYSDGEGNYGDIVSITITNIDKEAPEKTAPSLNLVDRSNSLVNIGFNQVDKKSGIDDGSIQYRLCDEFGISAIPGFNWQYSSTFSGLEMYKVYYAQTYCKDKLGNESYSDITKFKIVYVNDYVEEDGSTQLRAQGSREGGEMDEENILSDAQRRALEEAKNRKDTTVINNYYYYYGPQDGSIRDLAKDMEVLNPNETNNQNDIPVVQSNNPEQNTGNELPDDVERAADGSPVVVQSIHAVPVDSLAQAGDVGVITQSNSSDSTQKAGDIPAAGAPKTILIVLFVLNVIGLVFWKKSK